MSLCCSCDGEGGQDLIGDWILRKIILKGMHPPEDYQEEMFLILHFPEGWACGLFFL